MVQIHEEIDLVIKQANRYITYQNQKGTYNEFAHDYLRFANNSKIKQNFAFIEDWLRKNTQTDADDMLGQILNFNGLMDAIQNQTKDIDTEKFNQAQQYWNEAQNNLIDRDLYNAGTNYNA
jgi:hypothetical protein|tara:strand:+ start:1159 stop:1521 length:363 start_codon:yes stop_codon:yes gene_type:complete